MRIRGLHERGLNLAKFRQGMLPRQYCHLRDARALLLQHRHHRRPQLMLLEKTPTEGIRGSSYVALARITDKKKQS